MLTNFAGTGILERDRVKSLSPEEAAGDIKLEPGDDSVVRAADDIIEPETAIDDIPDDSGVRVGAPQAAEDGSDKDPLTGVKSGM